MANPLKAGTVGDLSGSMAGEIERAMRDEWHRLKNEDLPKGLGEEDRQILFVAVAKGVLKYLHDHRGDIGTTVRIDPPGGHQHKLEFNVS